MSLVVNHNMMAAHSSRILNSHYRKLSDSTRKLSSGLRVETAADDAAGLAIRELMRAEISTLNQGVRNANDAISLIQTADGAMQVIDEKLIRMKELAEQAATGTYDSTQRLIIESEYQQMASEITRIANATDFNNIKLLDGNLSSSQHDGSGLNSTGKLKVHFGMGMIPPKTTITSRLTTAVRRRWGWAVLPRWRTRRRISGTVSGERMKRSSGPCWRQETLHRISITFLWVRRITWQVT